MSLPLDSIDVTAAPPKTYSADGFAEDGVRPLFFDGAPYEGRPTRVFAWYGAPQTKPGEKLPAMVLVHGGGGTAFAEWVRLWTSRGYAAIAMDTCGCVPRGAYGAWERHEAGGPPGWGGFDQLNRPTHDHWTYQAVSSVIRAHSLLRSFAEVDSSRVGITGISWGGYLTSLVASLDSRFRFAVPVYGCGYYRTAAFWREIAACYGAGSDEWSRWNDLWDPAQYLSRATIPFLWLNGTNDFVYWPRQWRDSARLTRGPRTLSLLLRMVHAHGGAGENPEEIRVFADSFCKEGKPLARIVEQGQRSSGELWAKYESEVAIERAELLFTTDAFEWASKRFWQTAPATLDAEKHTAAASIPAGTTAAYLNLIDARGVTISTEHVEETMETTRKNWRSIATDLWLYRNDSCNVYAIRGPEGIVIIDAGTGAWIDHIDELPAKIVALACTHYFRDHSAGAARAARELKIPVYVPEGEREMFVEPQEHFRSRSTYIIYDNLWNLHAPIEGVPVAGVLRDYDKIKLAGREFEVIPQPGATVGQVGLGVKLKVDGNDVSAVFCGETIHSPGRVPRIAPFQYNYNDLGGAIFCFYSAKVLRERGVGAILPSLGEPILGDTHSALSRLQDNLRTIHDGRKSLAFRIDRVNEDDEIVQITENVWHTLRGCAQSWFIRSKRSGKVLAIDYGYPMWMAVNWPMYATPANRRAILHSMAGLKKHLGVDRIDTVLVSHFHDDHVNGIPLLQRLQGTQCWAAENFADLLSQPEAHCFPCDWHQPIRIDRKLALDKPFEWEEYTFHLHPMNGHTRFSALIGFEADGKRFAHTGDQYFFQPFSLDTAPVRNFAGRPIDHNHVYRNGALLDGYQISAEWMLKWRPEIVMQGHCPPMYTDDAFFETVKDFGRLYRELHERVMPLGESETHFNLDSWGGWIWPYRVRLDAPGKPATVKVTVRNPLPKRATLGVRLVGPQGWISNSKELSAEARAEVSCDLTITPTTTCRRQPFVVELTANGRIFGQVAEALMTVGHPEF